MEQEQLVTNNLSYSLIKNFDEKGPKVLIEHYNPVSKSLDFGSKVDDFISLTKEEFNNKYLIVQNKIDSDLLKLAEVISNIENVNIDNFLNDTFENSTRIDMINTIAIHAELFKRIKKDESRIKKFDTPEFYKFLEFYYKNKDKEFITPDEYSKLLACQSSLYNHKSTKKYFNCDENCEELYQVRIKYLYRGRYVKCILDKVIIDHKNKTIQALDLKTGAPLANEFMSNFFKFKYYLQAGLYNQGVIKKYEELNYKILPFKFIYLPTFDYNNPKVFIFTNKWEHAAWYGFTTISGYKYRGLTELMDEIIWHIDNRVFNETKEFYENEEILLKDDFINLI